MKQSPSGRMSWERVVEVRQAIADPAQRATFDALMLELRGARDAAKAFDRIAARIATGHCPCLEEARAKALTDVATIQP